MNAEVVPAYMTISTIEEVSAMSEDKLDSLPFGAIKLDKDGVVLSFNDHEVRATGLDPEDVVGRNFFLDVAPCTNVQAFAGRYRDGVAKGELHAVFPYNFAFKKGPRDVIVMFYYSRDTEQGWVFIGNK